MKGYAIDQERYRAAGDKRFLKNYGYYKILDDSCVVTYSRKNRSRKGGPAYKYYYSETLTTPVKNAYRKELRDDFGDKPNFYKNLRCIMKDDYASLFKPISGKTILFNKLYCETVN